MQTRFKHTYLLQVEEDLNLKMSLEKRSLSLPTGLESLDPTKRMSSHKLKIELKDYLVYYHTKRAHLSLDLKTPNEILRQYGLSDI
jgi:hypothetical protein